MATKNVVATIPGFVWNWQWQLVGNETPEERETLERMLREAASFCADMASDREPRWLTFTGKSGIGKTFLARQIVAWVKRFGERLYTEHERPRRDPDQRNYLAIYTYAQQCPMLEKWGTLIEILRGRTDYFRWGRASADWFKAIDDLGTNSADREGRITPFAIQSISELLDRRVRKWTVITSNYTRKQFSEEFDVRIASRLMRDNNVIVGGGVRDFALRNELRDKGSAT